MADKESVAPPTMKLPKGAIDREKWATLVERVAAIEKELAELGKKTAKKTEKS